MPRFAPIYLETGVDHHAGFMMVPLRGANLILVHDVKGGLSLDYKESNLDIVHIPRDQGSRAANTLYNQFITWGVITEDAAKNYSGAVYRAVNYGPNSRVLMVTGKTRGLHDVKVTSGGISRKLTVCVVPSLTFKVAYRYVQGLDESGKMQSITNWTPSDGQYLTNKLNWIYGPQANISFDMVSSEWAKINQKLEATFSDKAFLSSVASSRSTSADLTVFLVGRWKGGEAGGTYFSEVTSAVLEGDPKREAITEWADPFLVTFAHEVAHFLTYEQSSKTFHHSRPEVLLSDGIQSSRIDQQLLMDINSPW